MRKWPLGMCIWAQRGVWDRDGVHPPAILLLDASPDWRRGQVYVRFLETKLAGVCCSGGAPRGKLLCSFSRRCSRDRRGPKTASPPSHDTGSGSMPTRWGCYGGNIQLPRKRSRSARMRSEIFARIARMSARHDTLPRFLTVYILPERYFFIEKHMKTVQLGTNYAFAKLSRFHHSIRPYHRTREHLLRQRA